MRYLGLDVGSKSIGLALSDELAMAAYPLDRMERRGTAADVEEVASRARDAAVAKIVVGLPLDLDGSVGHRARRVMVLVDALNEKLAGMPEIVTWDERFSTVAAERVLIEGGVSREKRKAVIDKQAASVILQGYLNSLRTPSPDSEL